MKNILSAYVFWPLIFVVRSAIILLGLVVVPVALLFAYEGPRPRKSFTSYSGEWRDIRLPAWAYLWDNPSDGAMGDSRGWYWQVGRPSLIAGSDYLKSYYWLAFRNPANRASRYLPLICAYMPEVTVKLLAGQTYVRDKIGYEGWQFVKGDGRVFNYWGFYGVWRYGNSKKALVVRLGHKIEPRHNKTEWGKEEPYKRWKGMTFRINPIKDIG